MPDGQVWALSTSILRIEAFQGYLFPCAKRKACSRLEVTRDASTKAKNVAFKDALTP